MIEPICKKCQFRHFEEENCFVDGGSATLTQEQQAGEFRGRALWWPEMMRVMGGLQNERVFPSKEWTDYVNKHGILKNPPTLFVPDA